MIYGISNYHTIIYNEFQLINNLLIFIKLQNM
jgi:hypothetical protein